MERGGDVVRRVSDRETFGRYALQQGDRYYNEKRFDEAANVYRVAVSHLSASAGQYHLGTLEGKRGLAASLRKQKKYQGAEIIYRELVKGQEKTRGSDHTAAMNIEATLAWVLHDQGKYGEAEQKFREVMSERVNRLGDDNLGTVNSKYGLAISLVCQMEYEEAEKYVREAMTLQVKYLGQDHPNTLDSMFLLAESLYSQGKYEMGLECCAEACQRLERTLGSEHPKTLDCRKHLTKMWLEFENPTTRNKRLSQAVEDVASKDQKHLTRPVNEGQPQEPSVRSQPVVKSSVLRPTDQLSSFFTVNEVQRSPYTEETLSRIASLLQHQEPRWGKYPRTYVVLRSINCLDVFDKLLDSGFSDYWFPATEQNLSPVLRPDQRIRFLEAQCLVLNKSLDLEKGQHCFYNKDETIPLDKQRVLGRGSFGQVDEVISLISYERYARKRVLRRMKPEHLHLFVAELEIVKRLRHKHVVDFVGSYSDTKYLGILMRPVAEMDLSVYLARPDISSRYGELRTFFGCLATALNFLHTQRVRHKDIKPQNVLVHRGDVFLTDFGLSHDFTDANGSTTVGMVNGFSPEYCAPEVLESDPRNTSSDIWSLGVVFLEMLVVLKGYTAEHVQEYLSQHGSRYPYVRSNPKGMLELVASLVAVGLKGDNRVIEWVKDMLQVQGQQRVTASQLVAAINNPKGKDDGSKKFCGICCAPQDDDFSDFSD